MKKGKVKQRYRRKEEASRGKTLAERLHLMFKEHPGELFKTNEISKILAIRSDSDEYQSLRDVLRDLERDGAIIKSTRRRYGFIPALPASVTGIVNIVRSGDGIVTPDRGEQLREKVHVSNQLLAHARNGDRVKVSLAAERTESGVEGTITEVLQRSRENIESRSHERDRQAKKVRKQLETDDVPLSPKERSAPKPMSFQEEIRSLALQIGLPLEFPKDVLNEASSISQSVPAGERLDLRKEIIFTIDPEDAKDFDDAISLQKNDDGTVTLGVHIADVSHYVREGTALDDEALARSTSVYLAGGVIPMLPEVLSNEVCSLKPGVDRLTYSVIMVVDPKTGIVQSAKFAKSVICSVMRFSYEEAEDRTVTGKGKYARLLREMRALSVKMYELRRTSGSIDFETDEVRFRFDEKGNPISSYKKERLGSMRMIEEFMLAANRVVAEHISRMAVQAREKPFLYRIHAEPDPDKLRDLAKLAKSLGYNFNPENAKPLAVQKFLESIAGKPEEKLFNTLMLRAMAKAVYAEHNVGHFGLAFVHYTHFTSPIRRYPDLIIHRMLFEYEQSGGMPTKREHHYFRILPDIADQTSALERRAMEAERDSAKLAQLFVMKQFVGDEFNGIITGVQPYGCFVELENGAEGLLHVREMPGYYRYDEDHLTLIPDRRNTGRSRSLYKVHPSELPTYRIGERVVVKLIRVNEEKRALDFGIAGK